MSKKSLFLALGSAILAGAGVFYLVLWLFQIPVGAPAENLGHTAHQAAERLPSLWATASPGGSSEPLARLVSEPISLPDGGNIREFQVATDELYLRSSDGPPRILSIPASQTPAEFQAAIEKARAESGTEPELVLYPAGFPRNESTRRIVTREVVINAPARGQADAIAEAQGLVFKKALPFAPGSFVYEAPTSAKALAAQSSVDDSQPIKVVALLARQPAQLAMPNDPYVQLQWHLKFQGQKNAVPGTDINVESVWNYPSTSAGSYIRGNGTTIGIVDDGLEWNHPDLKPNALPELQWDWNQGDADPSPYYLSDAHGTACAGVAAARGNNRLGVSGVAPEASLVGMRLISDPVTDLDEAEAMAWLPNQVHIKSNSWGYYPFYEDPVTGEFVAWSPLVKTGDLAEAALKYATDFGRGGKGTIILFAAGNHDEYLDSNGAIVKSGARMDFADYQSSIHTIAVGAVGSQRVKSNYSQTGSALLISAPSNTTDGTGLGIMTTDNKGLYGYNSGGALGDFPSSGDATKTFGGTSSACPTVSGVVALMLEKNPALGWRDVQEILIRSANRTFDPAGWITNGAGIQFNYNYGAGLVDAAAAVDLADGWTNLPARTSSTVSAATTSIAPGANPPISLTVTDSLIVEHVTLAFHLPGIKKGDLQIDLTSPSGTNSVFCEPHTDQLNELEDWTFMTVRNWGENSSGNWTLTITNNGTLTGNLTASLTVYGTPTAAPPNPLPVVALKTSRATAFLGTTVTLNATAMDKNSNGTAGSIAKVEFFSNNGSGPVSIGNSTSTSGNNSYSVPWSPPAAGTYTLTATATDGATPSASATSAPVTLRVDKYPVAAWDFDTPAQSVVPLATAIQASRQYSANFGSNNGTIAKILFDGTLGSSSWSVPNGEIWTGTGSAENFLADSNPFGANTALTLRTGKNRAANGKSIVFELDMTQARRLQISYATEASLGGFTTHRWHYWDANSSVWRDIEDENGNTSIPVPATFSEVVLDQVAGIGFNGRANARVRLTVSGATAVSGTNLIDNIRFNATVAP